MDSYIEDFRTRNFLIEYQRVGPIYDSTKGNHEMIYQEFKMIEQGTSLWGVIGTWNCEETNRNYIFLYYDLDVNLIQHFKVYIQTFLCH